MATNELSIKLLIDTKTDKLCFAEAGSDVVDFLSGLLSLPLGTVANLLTKERTASSIGNVLGNMEKLDANYKSKEGRLSPAVAPAMLSRLQQLLGSHLSNGNNNNNNNRFFTCKGFLYNTGDSNHRLTCTSSYWGCLSATSGMACLVCKGPMDKSMTVHNAGDSSVQRGVRPHPARAVRRQGHQRAAGEDRQYRQGRGRVVFFGFVRVFLNLN
uniref:Uncharacterized protein n=2 Tax=Avena sativa TaxID=4498 RepID=A0ACD5VLX5_AVESA